VSAFCNLAASLTASRLHECFHEADEETLPRFGGQHWFINIGGKLASNPISSSNHPVFPFPISSGGAIEKTWKNAGDRTSAARVEESWREIAV
jgi:hypothetical protein